MDSNTEEIWKPVLRFEGREISNFGNIRTWLVHGHSHARRKMPLIMKQRTNRGGHKFVVLRPLANGKKYSMSIHRMVVRAFIGEIPSDKQVAHLDGNPANNHVSNLIIATALENASHKKIHGTSPVGERNGFARLTDTAVMEIKGSSLTSRSLAYKFGVCKRTVELVRNGTSWKHVAAASNLTT